MVFWALVIGAAVAVALLVILRLRIRSLATRSERALAFLAMGVVPCLWLLGMLGYTDHAMKKASFCVRCHEMQSYGESLLVDDDESLPAVHYRDGLVDRKKACYACHTRPGLGGIIEAKLKGLHDVKVHYFGEAPDTLTIHGEYPTSICLKCHREAASFQAGTMHQAMMDEILTGETSCLDCHDVAHELED